MDCTPCGNIQTMNFDQYQHVIFDFDETLATIIMDWSPWYKGVAEIVRKYQPSFDDVNNLSMQSVSEFINQYGQSFRDEYVNFEINLEKKNYQSYKIIQKTLDLFQKFHKQNKNLYLLTSNSKITVLPILEELKITNHFTKIVTLDDVRNFKPSPIPFELIYVEGNDKKQYLMVGDSVSDKGFAQNVGIDYLNVRDF